MTDPPSTVVSIQARMGSSRLPGKVLLPLGDAPVMEWTVTRSREARLVDEVVVAVGDKNINEGLIVWCDRSGYEWVVGSEENLLTRHLKVVEATEADTLVRITADSPFVPSDEIDRLIREHRRSGACNTTNFTDDMPRGTIIDVVDTAVLNDLASSAETHPIAPLRERSGYETNYSVDPKWADVSEAHLEINTPQEYNAVADALAATGADAYEMGEWLLNHQ